VQARAPEVLDPERRCEPKIISVHKHFTGWPMAHKFEIYKDKAGEFRVRFKYNSETMFSTEGYASKAGARNAIESIKKNGPDAEVDDTTD
jgi:uncharacterized protein YegP (UPF0339 family)